eukprot:CAMPEP_0175127060 /NCGR_PEP_ID=MMETSP0087-20121206/4189_1 /TAXON_ID=136419 /ORGANISM="Unknown Unknown, Strain D1" /LENGTH=757 /DNA_ID=CAMNT_0016409021 /DNA_START=14 /DNA_END=2287 /DNA_ORIENTATION=+
MAEGEEGVFQDVTALLRETAAGMVSGQMIHGANFSLREAMSALELMDPKMDPGMNPQDTVSLLGALEQNQLPLDLTVPQILSVMDELTASMMTWYNGHSIGHTLFTCLYLHRLSLIRSPFLLAFAKCLLKSCNFVRNIVLDADIYEEEDFYSNTFGFDLCSELSHHDLLAEMKVAEDSLEVKLKCAKTGKKDGVEPLQADEAKEVDFCNALLCRLRMNKAFYLSHYAVANAKANLSGLNAAQKYMTRALQQLELVESSLHLADPVSKEGEKNVPGFFPSVSRSLVANAPPRDVDAMPRSQALAEMRTVLAHFGRFMKLQELVAFEDILCYFKGLSSLQANIVVRSHLLLLLGSEDMFLGRGRLVDTLKSSFHRFSATCAPFTEGRDWDVYIGRMVKPVCLVFRLFCENHPRQRRRVPKLLPDWNILQNDSNVLDQYACEALFQRGANFQLQAPESPCRHPFFSWVFDMTTQLFIHHILLGLELELYTPVEMGLAFWHLEYLCDLSGQNRALAYRDSPWEPPPPPSSSASSANSKKGKKGKQSKKEKDKKKDKDKKRLPPVLQAGLLVQLVQQLSKGVHLAVRCFDILGLPISPMSQDVINNWFPNRFSAFLTVNQPVPLTLESYHKQTEQLKSMPAKDVCDMCINVFATAKLLATKVLSPDVAGPLPHDLPLFAGLKKVAIANTVSLITAQKLASSPQGFAGKYLHFDFTEHPSFPVLCVESKLQLDYTQDPHVDQVGDALKQGTATPTAANENKSA